MAYGVEKLLMGAFVSSVAVRGGACDVMLWNGLCLMAICKGIRLEKSFMWNCLQWRVFFVVVCCEACFQGRVSFSGVEAGAEPESVIVVGIFSLAESASMWLGHILKGC